jgi:hypothetical protein
MGLLNLASIMMYIGIKAINVVIIFKKNKLGFYPKQKSNLVNTPKAIF